MSHRSRLALALLLGLAGATHAQDSAKAPARKLLVELYTSQGCDSCPSASELLGKLGSLGYGPEKIVALGFHVDYFNTPWVDPYSSNEYSRRQASYNEVTGRDDLYFTPLLMIDGRYPMLGSDRVKVSTSLKQAAREAPGVDLRLKLAGGQGQRLVEVAVKPLTEETQGRDLLVGLALTEDPISTRVGGGENGGKTLVEHAVVRSFVHKFIRLDDAAGTTLRLPVALARGQDPAKTRVAAFVQGRADGRVHQAESIPWTVDKTLPAKDAKP